MARRLRVQFDGAIYHVINRGNYRRDMLETPSAFRAFRECIFEAFSRFNWRMHAFSLMINHYHLALQTPTTNLPEGMQWLQSTFATRFNRFREEKGHLFEGRYRAIVVEPGLSLARLVDYIHLNPVKAKIVSPEQVASYRWSSLHHFLKGPRPPFLACSDWLRELGLCDTPGGWNDYVKHLEKLAKDKTLLQAQDFDVMDYGWAIGTKGWREAIAKSHEGLSLDQVSDAQAVGEFKKLQWSQAIEAALLQEGRSRTDLSRFRKGADWKIRIAEILRSTTTATNSWIARELHMGSPSSVRQYLSDRRRGVPAYQPRRPIG